MSITYTGSIGITVRSNMTPDPGLSNPVDDLVQTIAQALANGTGPNQATQHWCSQRSLAATSETLDIVGSLTNAFGATVSFATVRTIMIRNRATTAGFDLKVGGAAANQFLAPFGSATDKLVVRAGGVLVLTAPLDGFAATGGSADQLKIDAGSNTVPYDIILIGT